MDPIDAGPSDTGIDPDSLRNPGHPCLPELLGIQVNQADSGGVVCSMKVREALLAPNGYLHAASVVGLADTACGYGTMVRLPEGARAFTTIELKCNFIGTAAAGRLTCRAHPVHLGRLTQVWDASVRSEDKDKVIAHFRCTQMILFEDPHTSRDGSIQTGCGPEQGRV
ncbi:MAG: PaaI family thioesterase [Desulfobacterales bacterium]|jgi:uncharacterized protein (TIGR00369 family)